MNKIKVGILCGGKSPEHDVSTMSAKNIVNALDTEKFEPVLLFIDKQGAWFIGDAFDAFTTKVAPVPQSGGVFIALDESRTEFKVDVIFPVLHGPNGEDGTVQGLLKIMDVPFVGAGVLGSAVGMDKDVAKRLLRDAGVPVTQFITATADTLPDYGVVRSALGDVVFIKPANMGSSVGVSRVTSEEEYKQAVQHAFVHDKKILIEAGVIGREIECAVLEKRNGLLASVPGEIAVHREFYSYEAKYNDPNGSELIIPAHVDEKIANDIAGLSKKVFTILCCSGFARVDFFLTKENQLIVNEINTIPGFTSMSMYPKMMEASGVIYSELISSLLMASLEEAR